MSSINSEDTRRVYGVSLKHGTWLKRLWLDGPAGTDGEVKFDEIRAEALKLAEAAEDVVDFKNKVLKLFAANDFHQCDT